MVRFWRSREQIENALEIREAVMAVLRVPMSTDCTTLFS
jgi:hypothetical protein